MSPQEQFDEIYITSSEICRELGVSRSALLKAKRRGELPAPIVCEQLQLWHRAAVRPYVDAWKARLEGRRGDTTA